MDLMRFDNIQRKIQDFSMSRTKSQAMTRIQIYIEPEIPIKAKFVAQSKVVNLSQYIRDLIKINLAKKIIVKIASFNSFYPTEILA
jgi:protein involved in sex pheromone biosynthesis